VKLSIPFCIFYPLNYIRGNLFHLPQQLCCRLSVCVSSAVASLAALFVTSYLADILCLHFC
jgi:hypothetical protein